MASLSTLLALAMLQPAAAVPDPVWTRLPADMNVRASDYRRGGDAECPVDYVLHLCTFAIALDYDRDGETDYVRAMVNRRTGGSALIGYQWGDERPPRILATWPTNIWRLAYLNAPGGADIIELVQPESEPATLRWNPAGYLEQFSRELPGD